MSVFMVVRVVVYDDVGAMAEKLSSMSRPDKAAKKSHVRHAWTQASKNERAERSLVCPRCGTKLIPLRGQYGSFYGCGVSEV